MISDWDSIGSYEVTCNDTGIKPCTLVCWKNTCFRSNKKVTAGDFTLSQNFSQRRVTDLWNSLMLSLLKMKIWCTSSCGSALKNTSNRLFDLFFPSRTSFFFSFWSSMVSLLKYISYQPVLSVRSHSLLTGYCWTTEPLSHQGLHNRGQGDWLSE